jgi:serine/threonine protein kinase
MDDPEEDATRARDEETVLRSPAGFTPPTPAERTARFPNLEVMELLGHGGMGIVYKSRQPFLDRLVAIKVIRPDLQTDDAFRERFLREARTLARLRHPFIVTVFDVCKAGDLYGLVMEYVEGASLRPLLAGGLITQRDALDFVPQIAQALQHAHEAGVVHRDIKPENVRVDSRGRVRLVDFGLATLFGPGATVRGPVDGRVVGTLRYMAPEQIKVHVVVARRIRVVGDVDAPGRVDCQRG